MDEKFVGEIACPDQQERIDTLFALACAFSQPVNVSGIGAGWFSRGSNEAQLFEQRAAWHAALPAHEQTRWVTQTLGRIRGNLQDNLLRLDRHVHPSQVAAALGIEPLRIQQLVLRHLPQDLAESTAALLGLDLRHMERRETAPDQDSARAVHRHIVSIVKRNFLSQFVSASALGCLTPFDLLSTLQLTQLQRMLGIRETAIACSAVADPAEVAGLLRRFATDDARAISRQTAGIRAIPHERLSLAKMAMRRAIGKGLKSKDLLDQIGLQSLSMALAVGTSERARYTAQKLPVETAQIFLAQISEFREEPNQETSLSILRDLEKIARRLSK
jgi:hypothetical protein